MEDYLLAQASVLGSILISPELAGDVVTHLRPGDFTDPMAHKLFLAIRSLYLDREVIDLPPVLERMDGERKGNRQYLLNAMDRTSTANNYRAYMAVIQRESRRQRLQSLAMEMVSSGFSLEQAPGLVAQMQELLVDRPGVECVNMEQALLDFYAELERTPEYLPWGIPFLDEGLTVEAGDLVVLGGRASDGKTALALQMAYTQAEHKRVGFFSLETKNTKLFSRLFSSAAGVSGQKIRRRTLDEMDHYRLQNKAGEIKRRELHLIRSSSMTVADIQAFARAKGFDVVYVDYLTLIPDDGRTEYERTTNVSKGLHRMAQDDDVTVVALSQLSRPGRGEKWTPTLSSLRSSGQIEQDADVVLFISREEPNQLRSRRILDVAKNKEGLTGRIPLLFRGDTMTFTEDTSGIPIKVKTEPEYKQTTFEELPEDEPIPFEEPPEGGTVQERGDPS